MPKTVCLRVIFSLLAPVILLAGSLTASAAVVPVPREVVPVKIPGARPRSVVFILTDDHRYDAMGFLGNPLAITPHLDQLAAGGAYLKNALVTTSLCSPSRASILTGLYTFRHRVIDNQRLVPEGTLFFPQYLQQAGYRTGFIGKWHMGADSDEPRPGFDYWVSFKGQGFYLPPNTQYTLNVNGKRVPQKGHNTPVMTNYALEFLEQQRGSDQPFFLYLSHKAVHGLFIPEEKYRGTLADKPFTLPARVNVTDENTAGIPRWQLDQRNSWHGADFPLHSDETIENLYKASCETLRSVDDSVGAVMKQLESMGILDETLIIYMGDNGYLFGEHGLIDKRVAYETSIRVPMLAYCPELIPPGTVREEMIANIDVGPTVMEAMGLARPPHMDGQSFLPLLQGNSIPWRDYFLYAYYWEQNYPQTPTMFSLRGNRFKYTTYYGLWDADELFDLQSDPQEQHNLIFSAEHASQKNFMQQRLYDMMEELGGMQIPLNRPRGNQSNKRLRSQGAEPAPFPEEFLVDEPLRKLREEKKP
ncbi:MAG: sulfatase [Planctomycetaceae bacterium]|nr:sulfatase [Planctomycetaceae bacterium]